MIIIAHLIFGIKIELNKEQIKNFKNNLIYYNCIMKAKFKNSQTKWKQIIKILYQENNILIKFIKIFTYQLQSQNRIK